MTTAERERPDLSNGGIVTVLLGEGGDLPTEYGYHSRVLPIEAWKLQPNETDNALPHNTRAVVFGGGKRLPRDVFDAIHEVLKRRRVMYLTKDSTAGVKDALDSIMPSPTHLIDPTGKSPQEIKAAEQAHVEAHRPTAKHGQVKGLIEAYLPELLARDAQMPIAEAARELFRMATRAGITTTIASLSQAVRVYKRDHGVGSRPQSVVPESRKVLQRIDAAIIELQQCRDYIEGLEARNLQLERQVAKAKEVFAVFSAETFAAT